VPIGQPVNSLQTCSEERRTKRAARAITASMLDGIKQTMLMMGSAFALIVVGLAIYFLVAYPGMPTFLLFFAIFPVFLILGLGLFKLARNGVAK
jgi:hypothetical protein